MELELLVTESLNKQIYVCLSEHRLNEKCFSVSAASTI